METAISGNFWSFIKHVEDPFQFHGKCVLSLKTLQRKRASSSVQVRISSFVWSCGGKLRVPHELPVYLGDPSCFLREVRSPLALGGPARDSSRIAAGMNRASSRDEVGTSIFLSISDLDHNVSAELEKDSQSSSRDEVGTPLASRVVHRVTGTSQVVFGTSDSFRTMQLGVNDPSCCDFIVRVTFEEVPGHRDLS